MADVDFSEVLGTKTASGDVDFGPTLRALDEVGVAEKRDKDTLTGMLGNFGVGVWDFVAHTAGLPGTALDWASSKASGLLRQESYSRRDGSLMLAPGTSRRDVPAADAIDLARRAIPTGDYFSNLPATISNAATAPFTEAPMFTPILPTTRGEQTARTVGENVGAALTFGTGGAALGIGRGTARAADAIAGRSATFGERAVDELGRRALSSPLGLATGETAIGAAAGAGQDFGERIGERIQGDDLGSQFQRVMLPLAGNALGGLGASTLGMATRFAGKTIKGSISPYIDNESWKPLQRVFGNDGAERIAAEILWRRSSRDVDSAMANLDSYVSELGDGNLHSAAQRTGDGGLLTLERAIVSSDAKRIGLNRMQEAKLNGAAQGYLQRNIAVDDAAGGTAAPESSTQWFRRIVDNSVDALDRRVEAAAKDASDAIAKLGETPSLTRMSAEARKHVDIAYRDARMQESALWTPLKADEQFKIEIGRPIRDELDLIKAEAPKAGDPKDFPKVVDQLMNGANKELIAEQEALVGEADAQVKAAMQAGDFGKANMYMGNRAQDQARLDHLKGRSQPVLEDFENIREVLALRSRVSDMARDARSESAGSPPNQRLAFNLDRLHRVITDRIDRAAETETTGYGATIKAANDYSRRLNDTFTRGPMAEILGRDARGGERSDPRVLLNRLVGKADEPGVVDLSALLDTEGFANAARQKLIDRGLVPEGAVGTPIHQLTEGYMAEQFIRQTAAKNSDGVLAIDPAKAEQFVRSYKEQLDQFPSLKANLGDSTKQSEVLANLMRDRDAQLKLESDTGRNALALWLDGDPDQAMARVLGANKRQGQMMRDLVDQAQRDPRGEALPAMRRMFFDEMMANGRIATQDADGLRVMTSVSLRNFLEKNARATAELLEPWQQRALKQTVAEIDRAESTMNARAFRGDSPTAMTQAALQDMNQTALSSILRSVFAAGRFTGSIHSLPFIGQATTSFDRGLSERVMNILGDALTGNDPTLLKTLLMKQTPENVPVIRARIRPYLLVPAAEGQRQPLQLTITPEDRNGG